MHDSPVSKLGFVSAIIISLLFTLASFTFDSNDESFVVFCNVGQGDASYIHIYPNIDVLIDAGRDSSVLNCLGKYMPKGDSVIELAFISHPQIDHYGGFMMISQRYKIKFLYLSNFSINPPEINNLISSLKENGTAILPIYANESLSIKEADFQVLWPYREDLHTTLPTNDPNNTSQVMFFTYNGHKILFTGDITPKSLEILSQESVPKVQILKIPHHGSKNGLTSNFLSLADPIYGVISLGKNNPYGHPSSNIIDMLRGYGVEILRTDELGDIKFSLD